MSNFKSSTVRSSAVSLESLVRTAMMNGELAPGVAAQISGYRKGALSCEERRMLAILDDAINDGCVVPVDLAVVPARRQVAYVAG
ncbi:MAG: hypothetical protein AB8B99_00715 [Phormidesmis sp.]